MARVQGGEQARRQAGREERAPPPPLDHVSVHVRTKAYTYKYFMNFTYTIIHEEEPPQLPQSRWQQRGAGTAHSLSAKTACRAAGRGGAWRPRRLPTSTWGTCAPIIYVAGGGHRREYRKPKTGVTKGEGGGRSVGSITRGVGGADLQAVAGGDGVAQVQGRVVAPVHPRLHQLCIVGVCVCVRARDICLCVFGCSSPQQLRIYSMQ